MESASTLGHGASLNSKKRTRILLSCAPCRTSKLKCDREQPCGQCAKKGRLDLCVYAPKPQKKLPMAKGMSARLRRLEGMVRNMMDDKRNELSVGTSVGPPLKGQVVHGDRAITYVGATHCLAMLEDIEDIKAYFDDPEGSDDDNTPSDDFGAPEMLLPSRAAPRSREELLALLPERHVADRLITRYFSARSPSQHIIHRPTFTKEYIRFWQDPSKASYHWLALLFMIFAVGIFFNNFSAPHEVEGDSPVPVHDRIKQYRSCAGWALVLGKYFQPTATTVPALILYTEADFLFNWASQTNCFILSGTCLRLLLKMGYHRDSSKLASISPFEGEMRRRQWNMAVQLDLLVSFHMGLPSMVQGIETDTEIPRNLEDDDFDEDCSELPPPRPDMTYTSMTYAIHKSRILRVFGKIAQQAHCLTPPSYSEVLKLDNLLQETWNNVPSFMHVRPLEECVGEEPHRSIQRFGLASIYHKSRCVLHRRYLAETIPKSKHDYSRTQCLEAATALLNFQYTTWQGSQPGNVLGRSFWFMCSLAVHDFMLAAMILYLVIQNENYADDGTGFGMMNQQKEAPTKEELKNMLRRSHDINREIFVDEADLRKTADTLAIMLAKLGCPVNSQKASPETASSAQNHPSQGASSRSASTAPTLSTGVVGNEFDHLSIDEFEGSIPTTGPTPASYTQTTVPASHMGLESIGNMDAIMANMNQLDLPWMLSAENLDWRHLDASIGTGTGGSNFNATSAWTDGFSLGDMDMMSGDIWNGDG